MLRTDQQIPHRLPQTQRPRADADGAQAGLAGQLGLGQDRRYDQRHRLGTVIGGLDQIATGYVLIGRLPSGVRIRVPRVKQGGVSLPGRSGSK